MCHAVNKGPRDRCLAGTRLLFFLCPKCFVCNYAQLYCFGYDNLLKMTNNFIFTYKVTCDLLTHHCLLIHPVRNHADITTHHQQCYFHIMQTLLLIISSVIFMDSYFHHHVFVSGNGQTPWTNKLFLIKDH